METKNTKFVSFSTQKGGVGKTTFTVLVASLLHYRMGYNVAILDCDYPQHSLSRMREQDLKTVMQNEHFKHTAYKQFSQINKKVYPIITCKPNEAIEKAQSFLAENTFQIDVVLFDMPGTVNTAGVLTVLSQMRHIFSPITADRVVIESTLSFTEVLSNIIAKNTQSAIESVHFISNFGTFRFAEYILSEKFSLKIERKKYSKPLPESKKTPEKPKQNTSIMGKSKFVPPKREHPLTEAEKQAILAEFEQENENYLPDFEDEEEDLRVMRTSEQDNDFATGLSFEDLEKVADFLSQNASSTTENRELAQKVVGTNLLEEIEKALPEASLKVAQLLDEILPQTPQKESDFDIEEFI